MSATLPIPTPCPTLADVAITAARLIRCTLNELQGLALSADLDAASTGDYSRRDWIAGQMERLYGKLDTICERWPNA